MTARDNWKRMYSTIRYARRAFGFVPTHLQNLEFNNVDLEFSYYCEDFYRSPNDPANYEICRRISFSKCSILCAVKKTTAESGIS